MIRARASAIATSKGLGTALLIAPPVLILIAAGVAASPTVHAPPVDRIRTPSNIPTPPPSITPAKKILSGIQAQLYSIAAIEKSQDHTTTVAAALIAMGLIGVALAIRAIRSRGRGGGDRGKNATDGDHDYPSGMNNMYREVYVQTSSQLYEENSTLNVGSGGDPFQPR